ncbi:hypothetical protein [Ekhidna sp.]|uniref:hypothetical protein n=1 Tax=Ekhidna sp. TaxID=2608089 RepID=UPI003514D508
MKSPLNSPKAYADTEVESIARVLNVAFIFLPVLLLVVLIRQILEADYDIALLTIAGVGISFLCRHQFLKGHLNNSVIAFSILFSILLTAICTLGNGVHDIGLIGFPIIIGFSSIILDFKRLIFTSLLSVVGLAWLVWGEISGLYDPIIASPGTIGDFIISSLLILMGGLVAFSLTSNMKSSMKRVSHEVELSRSGSKRLAEDIESKQEIIEETHQAVLNSLTYIQHLIDFKYDESDELAPTYESVKRKILVIECAHAILLNAGAPIILDLKLLVQSIFNRYEKDMSTKMLHIDLNTESCFTILDEAINFGICIIELVHMADSFSKESLSIKLSIKERRVDFLLSGSELNKIDKPSLVIELLTKQLKGTLRQDASSILLSFTSNRHS